MKTEYVSTLKAIYGKETHKYLLEGSRIIREEILDSGGKQKHELWYNYDGNGVLTGVEYDGVKYLYKVSQLGDVLGLYDTTGKLVVKYRYDAWGKAAEITDGSGRTLTDTESIGMRNPFRYRGYYYDTDTGWYYLNARYYDPETGRFINADGYASTGQGIVGHNMFVYCNNNPVMYADYDGTWVVSVGLSANATVAFGLSGSAVLVIDDNWNIGIQFSYAGIDTTSFGALDAGVGGVIGVVWDADTIYDLEGMATLVGASGGPGWYVGGDLIEFNDNGKTAGINITGGVGVGVDIHVTQTKTLPTVVLRREKVYTFYGGSITGIGGGTWKWSDSQAKKRGSFYTDDFGNRMYRFGARMFWVDGTDMYEVFE